MKDTKQKKSSVKDEKFVEDDDQRVIVFVAIAILVIIGVIIGLLIGCEKKNDDPNPETPQKEIEKEDDVVKHEDEDEDESDSIDNTIKTATKKKTKKKPVNVTFFLFNNEEETVTRVKNGKKVSPLYPLGYSDCTYYSDPDGITRFDFSKPVTKDVTIYMECELITYTVEYEGLPVGSASNNPTSYTVQDGNVDLADPSINQIFQGWYANSAKTEKINSLSKGLINLAVNNVITIYAKYTETINVNYYDDNGEKLLEIPSSISKVRLVTAPQGACSSQTTFYGWNKDMNSNTVFGKAEEEVEFTEDTNLYAVCGNAKIIFESEDMVVEERVYTDEELEDIDLPSDADLDLDTPTYFIKVEVKTDTSKEIVDNDTTPDDNQIKIGDVVGNTGSAYDTPTVGDNVEEHDMIFEGWETTIDDPNNPGNDITVPVDEDFVFTEDETTLDAIWDEQEDDKEVVNENIDKTPEESEVPEEPVEPEVPEIPKVQEEPKTEVVPEVELEVVTEL